MQVELAFTSGDDRDFWNWFYFMFNIDSNHGFMVSYDVVKERMLSRLMGWQRMKYEKL